MIQIDRDLSVQCLKPLNPSLDEKLQVYTKYVTRSYIQYRQNAFLSKLGHRNWKINTTTNREYKHRGTTRKHLESDTFDPGEQRCKDLPVDYTTRSRQAIHIIHSCCRMLATGPNPTQPNPTEALCCNPALVRLRLQNVGTRTLMVSFGKRASEKQATARQEQSNIWHLKLSLIHI